MPLIQTTQAPIRFLGKVETDEMLRAYKFAWRDTWQMQFRILFYCLLALGAALFATAGCFAYRDDDSADAYRFWAWGVLALICVPMSSWNLRRKVSRSLNTGLFADDGAVIVDDHGVLVTDGHANLQVPWQKFEGFRRDEDMVLYYISYPRAFVAFFRRLCEPSEDWEQFLTITKQRLKPR